MPTPVPVSAARLRRAILAAAASSRDVRLREFEDVLASQARLYPITKVIEEAWRDAFDSLSDALEAAVGRGVQAGYIAAGLESSLNLVNPSSVRYARDRGATLVAEIITEQRVVLRRLVARGIREGYTVHQTAQMMRSVVGLNSRLAMAVVRYRDGLIAAGRKLNDVQRLGQRYADRLLRYRADMIARTETIIASNVGQEQLWRVAQREGFLQRRVVRVWLTTADERTCPVCRPMDGQRVLLEEPFLTPDGNAVYTPGMTHPKCRCTEYLEEDARGRTAA